MENKLLKVEARGNFKRTCIERPACEHNATVVVSRARGNGHAREYSAACSEHDPTRVRVRKAPTRIAAPRSVLEY